MPLLPVGQQELSVYPRTFPEKPGLPSPGMTKDRRELVVAQLNDGTFAWLDGTVENGDPRDYKTGLRGKGNQLLADADDFPTFARRGLHANRELRKCLSVTGRSITQITLDGRPGRSSGAGFMAEDETILSVLWADNKAVKKMGLTHPDLARPWFHIWNIEWELGKSRESTDHLHRMKELDYHGKIVSVRIEGSRGWQESIFHDEILGSGMMEVTKELDDKELQWLKEQYPQLSVSQFTYLVQQLTKIRTGEMVPFYINRYGFYEGHTDYRIDPLATAFLFGLKTLQEIHEVADRDLYTWFTSHFTQNP